jgi:serine protease AprX
VSGVVALLLQARPDLRPDQVKWLLQRTAQPVPGAGTGAGYPSAGAAIRYAGTIERANRGLVPNFRLIRAYLARVNGQASYAEGGWDTSGFEEGGWDVSRFVEGGWNSTGWEEGGWDASRYNEGGWDSSQFVEGGWNSTRFAGAGRSVLGE